MAIQSRSFFTSGLFTGAKPNFQFFRDWIDSFWHKSDTIAIADVSGLQAELDDLAAGGGGAGAADGLIVPISNGGTIVLAADQMIRFMVVRSATAQVVKCGTSSGGSQIFNVAVASGSPYPHDEVFVTGAASTLTLHFTCTGPIDVLIQKISFS
jgi:hypothetical protein